MAVGDTAFYKTNTGAYRALEDTGADSGLIQGGYLKFNNINDYQTSLQNDLKKYQDLASNLNQTSWGGLQYKTGENYSGDNPFERINQFQKELSNIQSGQGIYAQGYNTGAKTINGNFTTAESVAQEKAFQDAVAAGTLKQQMVNGVATYLPTQTPTLANLNTALPPATGNTAALPGYTTDASGYQSSYPTINLQPGQSGENVKTLQNYLISLGYSIPAGATGFYGPQTQAAVKALQEKLGVDYGANPGFFGPKTQAALSQMGLNLNPNATVGGPKITQGTSGITGAVKSAVDNMSAIPSTMLGSNVDTSSVTAKRDTYQSLLEQYAQNQKNIADTQAKIAALNTQFAQGQTAIQGQTIPTGLEGAQAQALKEQIAFQQLPLTQQLEAYTAQGKVLQEMQKLSKPDVIGSPVVGSNGEVTVFTQNADGSISSKNVGNVGAKKEYAQTHFYTDASGNEVLVGIKADGSVEQQILGKQGKIGGSQSTTDSSFVSGDIPFQATIERMAALEKTVSKTATAKKELANYATKGMFNEMLNRMKDLAKSNMPAQERTDIDNAQVTIDRANRMANILDKYQKEGGRMDFLKGTSADIAAKIGSLKTDAKFREIATEMEIAFQEYRQQQTGAAFGAAENASYRSVVPSSDKSFELNAATIRGLKNFMQTGIDSRYGNAIGKDAYENIKSRIDNNDMDSIYKNVTGATATLDAYLNR